MSKTKIFVSSTCYDLSQIREDIRNCIIELGHQPYLSDYPSFPVIPNLTTIENCKHNIQENTDIFILIVGGRYGSVDKEYDKSITNIEYDISKEYGIESFIFVNETIYRMLPLWDKNEKADFSDYVDSPEIFKFIKRINSEQKWIFTFDKASDIIKTIKEQLSFYLKYLIDKKRGNRLEPLQEFSTESIRARQIAIDKPNYWEYFLTDELLRTNLKSIKEDFNDFHNGLFFRKYQLVSEESFLKTKFGSLNDFIIYFEKAGKKLEKSWGELGVAGDPIKIKKAVEIFIIGCKHLFEWEVDLKFDIPPTGYENLKTLFQGCAYELFEQVEVFPNKLMEPFKEPNPKGEYTIYIKFNPPSRIDEINREIDRLKNIN